MAARDLVRCDSQSIECESALERRGEQPVLGAEDVSGRGRGLSLARPGLVVGGVGGRGRFPARHLVGQVPGYVVEVADVGIGGAGAAAVRGSLDPDRFRVPGVVPPSGRWFAGPGHHGGDVDQPGGGQAFGDQGRGEPAERVRHDEELLRCVDHGDDGVGVAVQGLRVIARPQRGGDGGVAAGPELGFHEVPVPAAADAGAVDQREGAHAPLPPVASWCDRRYPRAVAAYNDLLR